MAYHANGSNGISYIDYSYEGEEVGSITQSGLGLGVRGLIGKRLNWHAGVDYVDLGYGGDFSYGAGFRYQFGRLFGLGLDVSASEDEGVSTGVATLAFRFQFADRE